MYRFKDINDNIIYIGKTKNIYRRISQHFSDGGHLSQECYDSTVSVEFATLKSHIDMDIYEMYLIDKIRPKYNTEFIYDEPKSEIKLEDLLFRPYDRIIRAESKRRHIVSIKKFNSCAYDITNDFRKYDKIRYSVITKEGKIVLTKRDFYIFKFIIENPGVTNSKISEYLFNNSIRSCQHRLKKLKDINFISSHRKDILSEAQYFINTDNLNLYKKAIKSISL